MKPALFLAFTALFVGLLAHGDDNSTYYNCQNTEGSSKAPAAVSVTVGSNGLQGQFSDPSPLKVAAFSADAEDLSQFPSRVTFGPVKWMYGENSVYEDFQSVEAFFGQESSLQLLKVQFKSGPAEYSNCILDTSTF